MNVAVAHLAWAIVSGALLTSAAPADPGTSRRAESIDLFEETEAAPAAAEPTEPSESPAPSESSKTEAPGEGEGGGVEDGSSLEWDGDLDDILSEYDDEGAIESGLEGAGDGASDGASDEGEGEGEADADAKERPRKKPRVPARDILTGSARLTSAFFHGYEQPEPLQIEDDALVAGIFRMLVDHRVNDIVSVESNVFLEIARAPASFSGGGNIPTAGSTESAYRLGYLSLPFWREGTVTGQLGVDRLALGLDVGRVSIMLGRFPINHTVSNFFTPNDLYAPFSAAAINRIYKPGVDAMSVSVLLGNFSSLEFVGALGYAGGCGEIGGGDPDAYSISFNGNCVPTWSQSSITSRISAVKWGVEWAAMGGKVAERWIAGGSLQGSVGPVNLRAEGHAGFPDADGDGKILEDNDGERAIYGRVAGGFDIGFVWRNANIAAEYAYFSSGELRPENYLYQLATFYPDDVPYFGQHHLGLTAGFQPVPILTLNAFSIVNLTDASGLAGPMLMLSISDEVDMLVGMYAPWGRSAEIIDYDLAEAPPYCVPPALATLSRFSEFSGGPPVTLPVPLQCPELRSEFGVSPLSVFLELRAYF